MLFVLRKWESFKGGERGRIMVVAMMGGDDKKRTFHDFLGMNRGDPVQLAAAWAQGGGKRAAAEAAPEGEAEALASMGLSSGGHELVLGNSNLGSG